MSVDFTITSEWHKGQPGPWVDLSGPPCPVGVACQRADGCAIEDVADCSKRCGTADTAPCTMRAHGAMNLLETYRTTETDSTTDTPAFLKLFLQGSSTWNDVSTEGGCVSPEDCRSRLVSPLPLHQTTHSFSGEPDIRTSIEYTVENRQACSGTIAVTGLFNEADKDSNGRLSSVEVTDLFFKLGIEVPSRCQDSSGQVVTAGTRSSCIYDPTNFTFQFASVSRCVSSSGNLWITEAIGSHWACQTGATCQSLGQSCCDPSEVPDNPDTGTRQIYNEFKCENVLSGNLWTVGSTQSCVNPSNGEFHPNSSAISESEQCEFQRSAYSFTDAQAATCLHAITGQQMVENLSNGDVIIVNSEQGCSTNNSFIFTPQQYATCRNASGADLSGWQIQTGADQFDSMVHACEYETSLYQWRPCIDQNGAAAPAASEDECIYSISGNTWVPEVSQRCIGMDGIDGGDATSQLLCEMTANDNTWFSDRWATINLQKTGTAELSWTDLLTFWPDLVPEEARCVSQEYEEQGNGIRE